jgi:catechol 2,3-dioxygenase-like lactoylglutathione lyase family enzyme
MRGVLRHEDRPGLYCVELRTANWEQAVEWYRQVLGLRVLVRVTDDGYALLEAGETRIALLARSATGEPSARISLAFEVRDLRDVIGRLKQVGEACETIANSEGLRELNITDPDGNRIRLFSWPKGR